MEGSTNRRVTGGISTVASGTRHRICSLQTQRQGRHCTRKGLQCTALLGPVATSLPTATTGWLIAVSILAGVRLGRKQAEDERVAHLQGRSEISLENEQQVLLKQQLKNKERALLAAELASQRLEEARSRAAQQERERQADNEKLLEEAARRKEKDEKARAAKQAAYEAKEEELRQELQRRSEVERKIRAEKLAALRAEEEQRRREAEEKRQQRELERRKEEAERVRQQQLELKRKAEERREMQRLSKRFTVSIEGNVVLSIPPEGTQTIGRLPRDAVVLLEVEAGSLLGGSAVYGPMAFESPEALREQLLYQLAMGASVGTQKYAAAVRLQRMMDEGPLASMEESEFNHWMKCTSIRAAARAAPCVHQLLDQFTNRRARLSHSFEAKLVRYVLPEEDRRRTSSVLQHITALVESSKLDAAGTALRDFCEAETELLVQDSPGIPDHVGTVLALAFFLDQMWQNRPARRVEASPWYESASNLVGKLLAEQVAGAPKDSLQDVAAIAKAVLPPEHVVLRQIDRLAEANLSSLAKARRKQREELLQAELAERLVEFEWPDRSQLAAAKQEKIEASTPIPERIWALKNVGSTLAMGGPGEKVRARQFLDRAVELKRQLVGSTKHPGMLPEFNALAQLLGSELDWEADSVQLRRLMLSILSSIAEAYVKAGDVASAVILLEASVKDFEDLLGLRQSDIVAATKRANSLFDTLNNSQKQNVVSARRDTGIVQSVVKKFEEEVASRQMPGTLHKFEEWNERGIAWLGMLSRDS